jgi:hypothetical protein
VVAIGASPVLKVLVDHLNESFRDGGSGGGGELHLRRAHRSRVLGFIEHFLLIGANFLFQ